MGRCEPLAQVVEHLPFKQRVVGSSPTRLTFLLSGRGSDCQVKSCLEHTGFMVYESILSACPVPSHCPGYPSLLLSERPSLAAAVTLVHPWEYGHDEKDESQCQENEEPVNPPQVPVLTDIPAPAPGTLDPGWFASTSGPTDGLFSRVRSPPDSTVSHDPVDNEYYTCYEQDLPQEHNCLIYMGGENSHRPYHVNFNNPHAPAIIRGHDER